MLAYPSKIRYIKSDKAFSVEFPDLPGCLTYGMTLEEAKENAKEVLTGFLSVAHSENIKIKPPSKKKGKDIYFIQPENNVAFAILLRFAREKKGLTQKDVATKLAISYQAYQKYETPSKANPTLKTISKLEEIFEQKLIQI